MRMSGLCSIRFFIWKVLNQQFPFHLIASWRHWVALLKLSLCCTAYIVPRTQNIYEVNVIRLQVYTLSHIYGNNSGLVKLNGKVHFSRKSCSLLMSCAYMNAHECITSPLYLWMPSHGHLTVPQTFLLIGYLTTVILCTSTITAFKNSARACKMYANTHLQI